MTQRNLFDLLANPAAHTNDPATSHEAADRHQRTGRRDRHARLVLALVQRHPGLTAVELWHAADAAEQAELVEMQEVRRRLTDLAAAGKVCQGEARLCQVKGSRMVTWVLE